jgi:rod shape-determining protein MreC
MREPSIRPWLPLALIVIALLLLVFSEAGTLGPLTRAFHYVLDPLLRAVSGGVESTGSLFQMVRDARELRTQVDDLQRQVDALTVENVRLREYEAEVQQLRDLLGFVGDHQFVAPLGADVISRDACDTFPCGLVVGTDPNPYLRNITINVGSREGLRVGMPVVSGGAALVGRIIEVSLRTCKVQLVTDANSAVASLLQTTRATGLVVGQPDGSLRMDYVAQQDDAPVAVGDIVLTSGLGGVLPKGLVVGQVAEVASADYELFEPILVRPAVDFSRLEIVLVLTEFEPQSIEEVDIDPAAADQ